MLFIMHLSNFFLILVYWKFCLRILYVLRCLDNGNAISMKVSICIFSVVFNLYVVSEPCTKTLVCSRKPARLTNQEINVGLIETCNAGVIAYVGIF